MTATRCQLCDTSMTELNTIMMCPHCDSPCRPDHKPHCRPGDGRCECCDRCNTARNRNPRSV